MSSAPEIANYLIYSFWIWTDSNID